MVVLSLPSDVLNDLCSRFLVNLPLVERSDMNRVCFQIEQCHWFYLDFNCQSDPRCQECGIREFIRIIFQHCPFLTPNAHRVDEIIDSWRQYKSLVPTYGAILLDCSLTKVLLVQGYYATSSWGFPKGKVNEDELPHVCAKREVKEETSFDIAPLLDERLFLEATISETTVRLYIIPGVPESFPFACHTRNEIKDIRWFNIDDLPIHRNDKTKEYLGHRACHFFTVSPFIPGIKDYIRKRSSTDGHTRQNALHVHSAGKRISIDQLFPPDERNALIPARSEQSVDAVGLASISLPGRKRHADVSSPAKGVSATIANASSATPSCEIRPAVAWQNFSFNLTNIVNTL